MPQSPRTSKFTTSTPIVWVGGALLDGYMAIGLAFPRDAALVNWPNLIKGSGSTPPQQLPQWCKIPISAGVFDQGTELWYNADIDPPNTQYVAYFFDNADKLIAPPVGTATFFTISTPTTTITVPSLVPPTSAVTAPSPEI